MTAIDQSDPPQQYDLPLAVGDSVRLFAWTRATFESGRAGNIGSNGGAALTYDAVADLIGAVADANAETGALAFLSNTKVRRAVAKMKDSQNRPLGESVVFQGLPRAYSNLVLANGTKGSGTGLSMLIYGNWSDLPIGVWSELDILVNPYESTAYSKGNVQIRSMLTVHIAVRHPESFAAITDIVA